MKREMKISLWEEYLNVVELPEQQKKNIKELAHLFFDNVTFLYTVYASIGTNVSFVEDTETGVRYEEEGSLGIFRKEKTGIFLEIPELKALLADMIMLFEEILPLGTVVDLKKDALAKTMDVSKVQQFRVIVTKRFIGAGEGCYYPYGAVVYPIGVAGTGKVITFTAPLIEKVVFTGYSDDVEEAFVYQMKYHLIIEQRRKSAGFATQQEISELENTVCGLEERYGR